MDSIIEKIYYSDLIPEENDLNKDSDYYKVLITFVEKQNLFKERLNAKERQLFNEYANEQSRLTGFSTRDSYVNGFRLGAKIMYDTFLRNK